jgi:hemolysin activation/secretion protein
LRAIAKVSGQVSSAPLVASEQFTIGGPDTVRGYRYKERMGDNAFNSTIELRALPVPGEYSEAVQLVMGLDYGFVQQRKQVKGVPEFDKLLGFGPGVRLTLPFKIAERPSYFSVRFDIGFPINPVKIDNRTSDSRPVYYVQTALRF